MHWFSGWKEWLDENNAVKEMWIDGICNVCFFSSSEGRM